MVKVFSAFGVTGMVLVSGESDILRQPRFACKPEFGSHGRGLLQNFTVSNCCTMDYRPIVLAAGGS